MFDTVELLPDGQTWALDTVRPGPVADVFLANLDVQELSYHDRIRVLQARRRLISHHQAELARDIEAIHRAHSAETPTEVGLAHESTAAEIAAALTLTRRAAESERDFALELRERLRPVWNAMWDGLIDRPKAWVIARCVEHLPEHTARRIVERILPVAPRLTSRQIGARVRKIVLEIDRDGAVERRQESEEDRRVELRANPTGTAELWGRDLPAVEAAAAARRLYRHAKRLRANGDPRSIDQIEADLYLHLLSGGTLQDETPDRGVVDITVSLDTLTELDDAPGELAGYGPVAADIARQTAAAQHTSPWTYQVTDPHGQVVHTGTTRRRPTTDTARTVRAQRPRCCFPGCRMPSRECDLDHTIPWAQGGPTCQCNLIPLCRHHHRLRDAGWTYTTNPDRTITWTSPLGTTYTTDHDP